jgi:hypothetical protein
MIRKDTIQPGLRVQDASEDERSGDVAGLNMENLSF